jgi:hypothetical protein
MREKVATGFEDLQSAANDCKVSHLNHYGKL